MAVTETTAYNPGKFEIPASSLNWKQLSPAHSTKWEEDTRGDIRLEVPQQICSASTVIVAHGRASSLELRGAKQGTSQPTPCFSLPLEGAMGVQKGKLCSALGSEFLSCQFLLDIWSQDCFYGL